MSKVYIPQVPSRFDKGAGVWVPNFDVSGAAKFGEVVTMMPPEANRLNTAPLAQALREKMAAFTADDYVVALGDPTIFAIVACLAVRHCNGNLRMLKWDRMTADYLPVEVRI